MRELTDSEQWLIEQARSNMVETKAAPEPGLEEVQWFTKAFWPFMEPYYSPLKPVFSFELSRSQRLQQNRVWMFRDGAIPLCWFFESVSIGEVEPRSILIHESLGDLVPSSWRECVKLYELFSEHTFNCEKIPKRLFLLGPVNPAVTSLEDLSILLSKIKSALGGRQVEEIMLYAPVRHTESISSEEESFECQFYHRLFTEFGAKMSFVHWQNLEYGDFVDTAVVDLNGGWIYKDNAVMHMLLSRGAGLLSSRQRKDGGGERVPLSKHHGIQVFPISREANFARPEEKEEAFRFYAEIHRKIKSPRLTTPWPKWFQLGMRSGSKPG